MPFTKQPQLEPIPGYRLIEPLGSGGFGEVWKCEAPGGLFKAIKFVYGNLNGVDGDRAQAHDELQAVERIKAIRHPFLLSMDRVESGGGELMIVTELADKNLHQLLVEYQQKGQPGVPRDELLRYLTEAAEVLDLMSEQHGLQHLDVKPRNFFLVSNHVKVADFGLVTSMGTNGAGVKLGAVTPLYASPEVFQGKVSRTSDQYSLAIVYQELLTGRMPFDGRNSRQLLLQHMKAEPNLTPLPEADRALVARALAKDPQKRFASCLDFVRALAGAGAAPKPVAAPEPVSQQVVVPEPRNEALAQTPDRRPADTDTPRPNRPAPALPAGLAGYQLIETKGSSLLADAWKATAPDGRPCLVQFVYGFTGRGVEDAVRRLRALQHPALPTVEVAQTDPGRLVVVSELPKDSLRERFQKCQAQRLAGIPRAELLSYLRTVAEMLDYQYQQHSLHHLGLNPRNLWVVDGHLEVAEFGLAHLFWVPAGQPVAQRNARYSAPELFDRQVNRGCDQYSLAVIYQELLTGAYAFSGQGRAPASGGRGKPDLSTLPPGDRAAIGRALEADPQQRWPSCTAMIDALEGTAAGAGSAAAAEADAFTEVVTAPHATPPAAQHEAPAEAVADILNDLIAQAGGTPLVADAESPPRVSASGEVLQHKFRAGLPVGAARVKLDAFRQQCNGQLVNDHDLGFEFHVPSPANFWQQWMGRQAGLDVQVQLARPHALSATPIDVLVTITAVHCGKKKAARLVQDMGTNLLEGLRAFLLSSSEKRTQDRLMWPHPVQVCAVEKDGTVGPPITCRGKDISLGGIGFYLPHELPTAQVVIRLPSPAHPAGVAIPATLVRAKRGADGWYDVGALFRLATLRQSRTEFCVA